VFYYLSSFIKGIPAVYFFFLIKKSNKKNQGFRKKAKIHCIALQWMKFKARHLIHPLSETVLQQFNKAQHHPLLNASFHEFLNAFLRRPESIMNIQHPTSKLDIRYFSVPLLKKDPLPCEAGLGCIQQGGSKCDSVVIPPDYVLIAL